MSNTLLMQPPIAPSPIKRVGIGYYELEDGQIVDKGLYELSVFLDAQCKRLDSTLADLKRWEASLSKS